LHKRIAFYILMQAYNCSGHTYRYALK